VRSAERVLYLFNPDNTPAESLGWLRNNEITSIRLDGASHWMAVDQPELMAQKLLEAIAA
jgi:pimeloyl-ACP methyl ester carboxylesterase